MLSQRGRLTIEIISWSISMKFMWPYCIMKIRLFKYIENFTTKNEYFQMKTSGSFHISVQNINCVYLLELLWWGSSNEYQQSMFLSRNKKIDVYHCKPQFYCIKVGFKRVKTILAQTANAKGFPAVTFKPEKIRTRNFGFSGFTQLSLCPYMPLSWLVAIHWARSPR